MPEVNPKLLEWAREAAGLTPEEAAARLQLGVSRGRPGAQRLETLERGDGTPSRALLARMAKHYRQPLIAFYLSDPPRRGDRGKDFRRLTTEPTPSQAALLDALIRDLRARQALVRALLESEGEARILPFVGSVSVEHGISAVLASMRAVIGVELDDYRGQPDLRAAFALLREAAEAAGVFVLLKGDLGSHHSALDPETFRGYALADEIAPLVVVNDRDSRAAWSFTLLHELAHILLGETGISGDNTLPGVERFCNDVASHYLLPDSDLSDFDMPVAADVDDLTQRAASFAQSRNVSASMVAYRLYRARRLEKQTWLEVSRRLRDIWLRTREIERQSAREREGGPNFYVVRRHRIGEGLMNLVGRMLEDGVISTSKAATVLGVGPKQVGPLLATHAAV
jgi:Zn-dependent peptidase ImmA (M78 family)/transcriptional regulator with XRE-family HTH domain